MNSAIVEINDDQRKFLEWILDNKTMNELNEFEYDIYLIESITREGIYIKGGYIQNELNRLREQYGKSRRI